MPMPLYAGIDLGTSGVRCSILDQSGELLDESRVAYTGGEQQDPEQWWEAVVECLLVLPESLRKGLTRLGIDGTSGTVLATDLQGKPLTPALMYDDQRATEQSQQLAGLMPSPDTSCSALARLLWLVQQYRLHAQPYRLLHQADFIVGRLSGEYDHSDENNALKSGYDPLAGCWPGWIAQTGIAADSLPKVHTPGDVISCVDPAVARKLGLSSSLQLVAGTTDSIAAFLATGASQPGQAVTSLGSTLVIKMLSNKPLNFPEYGVYSHKLGRLWLVGGASNCGGRVLRKYFSDDDLQRLSAGIDPAYPTGFGYYPLTRPGERFPINDPDKQPWLEPRPDSDALFLQGLFEALADVEAQAYRRLQQLGAPGLEQVMSVGGGASNPVWRDIRARTLQVPVSVAKFTEASYGVARLALSANI